MAKILFGNVVGDARGSVGAITYSRNTAGAYTRQRVSPVQPRTPRQLQVRAAFSSATQGWNALTDEQRLAWAAFAESHPVLDVFNNPVILSGIAFYTRVTINLTTAGLALLTDPPGNFNALDVGTISINPDSAGQTMTFSYEDQDPVPAGSALVFEATPGVSPGRTQVGNLFRVVTVLAAAVVSPFGVGALYIDKFGTIIEDSKIFARAYLITANGAAGPRRTASAIVS